MAHLIATVGISGSGKSTWARAWVAESPTTRIRVNRDDIRVHLFADKVDYSAEQEAQVTKEQTLMIVAGLTAGLDVVVDNTHLQKFFIVELANLATNLGATFEAKPFIIDVAKAKANVAKRVAFGGLHVPDEIIDRQANSLAKLRG